MSGIAALWQGGGEVEKFKGKRIGNPSQQESTEVTKQASKRIIGAQLSVSRVKNPLTRDELIEESIGKMQQSSIPGEDFIVAHLPSKEPPQRGKYVNEANRHVVNNIFGAPKPVTPPRIRLRPNPDSQLERLYQPDKRREEAAAIMVGNPTLVDVMDEKRFAHPAYANHVEPRESCKRRISVAVNVELGRLRDTSTIACGVDGFPGLGVRSQPEKPRGRHCLPPEPFVRPEPDRERNPHTTRKDLATGITGDRVAQYQAMQLTPRLNLIG